MAHGEEIAEFCTIREAARRSGLAPKTWYEGAAGTGTIPRVRFGRAIRLLRKDVEKFINQRISEAEQTIEGSVQTNYGAATLPSSVPITED